MFVLFIGFQCWVVLMFLNMLDFQIILVLTWIYPYHIILNDNSKIVTLEILVMGKLVLKGVSAFLTHLLDFSVNSPFA